MAVVLHRPHCKLYSIIADPVHHPRHLGGGLVVPRREDGGIERLQLVGMELEARLSIGQVLKKRLVEC
jgi:hypothetical protein